MKNKPPSYQRHRFPSEIISHSVWLYHRFCLSFREVEELLAERGITVTYETVRQMSQRQLCNNAYCFGSDNPIVRSHKCGILGVRFEIDNALANG